MSDYDRNYYSIEFHLMVNGYSFVVHPQRLVLELVAQGYSEQNGLIKFMKNGLGMFWKTGQIYQEGN
ncbi:TPA: hypothetical protein ACP9DH_002889 [Legionella anisa]